jgi:hypothetical protein
MEDQNLEQSKSKKIKFIIWFVILLFGVITVVNLALFGWYKFTKYINTKKVQQLAEELKKEEEEKYQRLMADTYGGKTPQETLKMYIDAVQKGDYELASKYFIESKREKEKQSLLNSKKEDIENILNLLKQSLKSDGSFSADKNGFTIRKPILVDFVRYPNGIWKIIEI